MRKTGKVLSFVAFYFLYQLASAQTYEIDANIIEKGYLSPALSAFGTGSNQAWYNTAKPQKTRSFNFTLTTTNVNVPTSYYVDNTKLTTIERLSGPGGNAQSGNVPTAFGPSTAPRYNDITTNNEFDGQEGLNQPALVSMLQVGYGFSNGSEVKLRYSPSNNLYGLGVMHDVKQYFSKIKSVPFDISSFIGYTQLSISSNKGTASSKSNTFSSKSATIQGLISKNLSSHFTAFAGLGYDIATSTFNTENYSLGSGASVPINLSVSSSGPRATLGLRLKFSVFTFHTDFSIQKNPSLTLGLGLSGK